MRRGMQGWFHANGVDPHVAYRKAGPRFTGWSSSHASMLSSVEALWALGVVFLSVLAIYPVFAKSQTEAP
ncbi:MAG: hypothetical protein WB762_23230 [Candidatus Sulfotelmatobacter sp.]